MEKSQEIVHPRVASMEQIKLSVRQSLNEVLQINRRCVIHGAQSRMNLNYQTMFSRQSANVVNHVFIEVPVGCFCGVLLAIGGGSTAFVEIPYSVALIIGNCEFQDTVLPDILADHLQITIKTLFIYTRNIHRTTITTGAHGIVFIILTIIP